MRKVVTLFVLLSLCMAYWSCESQPMPKSESGVKQKKPAKIRKPSNSSDNMAVQDTAFGESLSDDADSLNNDSLADQNPGNDFEILNDRDSSLAVAKKDTVIYKQYVDSLLTSDRDNEIEDSEELPMDDSYSDQENLPNSGLNLEKERLLKTEVLKVYRPDYTNTYDSTLSVIEKRIALHPDEVSQRMVVERWISPVNYRGYKFNRKKLMLYGVDKNDLVHIYYYLDGYYFSLRNHIYSLKETNNNTAFTIVKDSNLENHLLEYEDQL